MFIQSEYSPAEIAIRKIIIERGPITFAEFMEIALYYPGGGYYTNRNAFGPMGDFFTAPVAHPVFGTLIAEQIRLLWKAFGMPPKFNVVELGAGNGQLGIDVMASSSFMYTDYAKALNYIASDLSSKPPDYPGTWIQGNMDVKIEGPAVILANELLDAMPVHRVTAHQSKMLEIFIGLDENGNFKEILGELSSIEIGKQFYDLGISLHEGYRTEINIGLAKWLQSMYSMMDSGYLLLIDYGHESIDYYSKTRPEGTLRCYYAHTLNMDPYRHVGKQDISVHVDFTNLRKIAHEAGFDFLEMKTQAQFLLDLGIDHYRKKISESNQLDRVTKNRNTRLIDLLIDKRSMGGFGVFLFGKNAPSPTSYSLESSFNAPLILATQRHMP
ncbi:MAG: hypothetical protein FI734_07940 [SAR202 cluster bacterium]|nr:hypothetical protein [SAR202 cluster bacterium]|tara:strand:- start:7290 stop:8441 length:1152 start_codon:yes stop_codon:yes gene_type:complete